MGFVLCGGTLYLSRPLWLVTGQMVLPGISYTYLETLILLYSLRTIMQSPFRFNHNFLAFSQSALEFLLALCKIAFQWLTSSIQWCIGNSLAHNWTLKCFLDIWIFADISGPFYEHGLTLIPAWISNHMPSKVWDDITYPFLNINGATVEV